MSGGGTGDDTQGDDGDAKELYARVHAILGEARVLSGAARDEHLARACGDDETLRAEVLELLALGDEASDDDAFAEPHVEETRRALEAVMDGGAGPTWLPETIGEYRVLRQLGQGGMGIVYEAEQASPHRRVAIKLLHPMHSTPDRLRRFRQEAAVLGRLQHPGIAQIFEAGTYDAGRGPQPFFAMELVKGTDLRTHCERNRLDLRARVELLAQVADAVHHAHEHGIVHRDLKPDNVLVDARGNPRVLDFGIARVESASATLSTIVTEEGQLVGTLAYMAPEQLEPTLRGVTPQADVYALGVLGFELLVGRLPHDVQDLSLSKAITLLTTRDVPRAGRLDTSLRGDLETILGKALEPETSRRYTTAAAFAADLRRHLNHLPIQARPPSRIYLARKFTRRHRGLVGGAIATVLTLVIGLAVSLSFADEAREQAERATANERRAIHGLLQSAGTLTATGRPRDALRQLWLVPREGRGFAWWMLERHAPHVVDAEQGFWRFLDDDHLVLGGDDALLVYSLVEQRLTRELFRGLGAPTTLGATPSGLAVGYVDAKDEILLLDLEREVIRERLAQPLAEEELPGRLFVPWERMQEQELFPRRRYAQVSDDGRTVLHFPSGDVAEVRRDEELLRRVVDLGALETVRLGPDGRLLAVNRRDEVRVTDLASGELRFRYAFDPDQGAMGIPVRGGLLLHSAPDLLKDSGVARMLIWAAGRRAWRRVELPTAGPTLEPNDPFRSNRGDDRKAAGRLEVNFTPDGRVLSVTGAAFGRGAWLFDPATGEPLDAAALGVGEDGRGGWLSFAETTELDGPYNDSHMRIAPSGRRVAVVHRELPAVVVELNASPDSGVLTLHGHAGADGEVADGWIYHLAMSHDGSLLASAAPLDPFVRVWDARTGEQLARLERGPCIAAPYHTTTHDALMAFTADDGRLVLTTTYEGSDPRVVVWDPVTGEVDLPSAPMANASEHTLVLLESFLDAARPGPAERLSQRVHALEGETWAGLARPNSTWFGSRPEPGPRWRYVPARGEVAGITAHPELPHVALVRNSKAWSVGSAKPHEIYDLSGDSTQHTPRREELLVVLDARTGERLVERDLHGQPWCAAYSPDGSLLAIGTHSGRVLFFETEHYEQQLDWPAHDSYVYSLAWTPDGTRLVTASGDATLRVWDSRPRVAARREDDAWRALRAEMAAREDLVEVYAGLEGEERAAARAELMRRRDEG